MNVHPEVKFYIDWSNKGMFVDETENVINADIPLFRVDMLSDVYPKSGATSGKITLNNMRGRYSLNPNIPNKDTALEVDLEAFGIKGVPIAITMSDDDDPATLPYTSIFYGSITSPVFSGTKITFNLQDRLSYRLQHKIDTQMKVGIPFENLIRQLDPTGQYFKTVGGFPFSYDFAWATDTSLVDEVISAARSALAYVVADNSPVISIFPWDYMIVNPLDEININIGDVVNKYIEVTSKNFVFTVYHVPYIEHTLVSKDIVYESKERFEIRPGDNNKEVTVRLDKPIVNWMSSTVSFDIVKQYDTDDVTVSYDLKASTLTLYATNNSDSIAFISNVVVEAYSIATNRPSKRKFVVEDDPDFSFERTFQATNYIQNYIHADWIGRVMQKRMKNYSYFGRDIIKLTKMLPDEQYVFGRPVVLTDEFGTSDKYYIFEGSAKFDAKKGLWYDLTLISHKYLYGDDALACGDYYIIGAHELDNTRVCSI